MVFTACLMVFLPATSPFTPPPAYTPRVELAFNRRGTGDGKGKRFNEIIPADQIKRIVRLSERGFARDPGASGEQADYDAFLAHLLDSTSTATGWVLGGNEGTPAELVVLTKRGRILRVEVVGTLGSPSSPTGILVHEKAGAPGSICRVSSTLNARNDPGR